MPDDVGSDCPPLRRLAVTGYVKSIDTEISTVPLLAASGNIYKGGWKRCFDVVGASVLLLLFAPILLFVACIIVLVDGFPILFIQPRVGRGLNTFPLIKFRTMVRDAEAALSRWKANNPTLWQNYVSNNFKITNDPRLIRRAKFMRRFSIDELPQLWNVLRGDMSLVGPRPLLANELPYYTDDIRLYASMRPGITGLWQVSGRSETTFLERATLDRNYVQNVTLLGDCKLLLRTIPCVFSGNGAF